ncbi:endo alpha-1,4 polygalactosaminidase [Deferribacter autotrophicus]|uniref:endo alpha-1,4 polygalactosaminidase n=1 Tax=Deferribacter autotrophicus TaxID=500465 RepID=UPI00248267EA|nr:endo alpha-1,4 polygalactosaminidase [Deferribacter autotrophicus]
MNEQCHEFDECDLLMLFINSGKPVFNAEYNTKYIDNESDRKILCEDALSRNFRTIVLPLELDGAFVLSCDY